jgi:hypothetical protein
LAADQGKSLCAIQFIVNGSRIDSPIELDANGVARWTSYLDVGKYTLGAVYIPPKEGSLLPSTSLDKDFVIGKSTK